MLRQVYNTLGFFGLVKCIILAPYIGVAHLIFEQRNKRIAEANGMTLQEYIESLKIR